SFSNRMFYQKAIALWRDGSEASRVALVKKYFDSVPGFGNIETVMNISEAPTIMKMMGLGGGDPFYAVIAEKMQPLVNQ
ncbi:MAG: SAM-dependent methyltransferase, partial [Cyanobacteria bacterium J06648_10]